MRNRNYLLGASAGMVICFGFLLTATPGGGEQKELSATIKRFKVNDSENEFYTLFRYRPVEGLGYEPGVGRRDPSTIIKVGDLHHVWYTRISGAPRAAGVKRATDTPNPTPSAQEVHSLFCESRDHQGA